MCLILFAYRHHPRYELVLAANRDEFYARPSAPMHFWDEAPDILAGRDLQAGGTWLGATRNGRFAVITNYRDPRVVKADAPSRGRLVSGFLQSEQSARDFMVRLATGVEAYNGFNLLVRDGSQLIYFSNQEGIPRVLGPGIYGLSNHLLSTPWPKVERGRRRLAEYLEQSDELAADPLLDILQDRTQAPDSELPSTGVSLEWERALSPLFIEMPTYGTRSSTIVLMERDGAARFLEKTWPDGAVREFRLDRMS